MDGAATTASGRVHYAWIIAAAGLLCLHHGAELADEGEAGLARTRARR